MDNPTLVFMKKDAWNPVGYTPKTTFWSDFSIADAFGADAVRDTFKRVVREWKKDVVYMTELVLVLNHKIWQHNSTSKQLSRLYEELWNQASLYAEITFTGEELDYYYMITD